MNSLIFIHLIHTLMFAMGIVQGSEKHMICKQVEDVFAPSQELGSAIQGRIQGIPGKRGIPGIQEIQRIQGPEGPPGVIDYEHVNSTVKKYIRPASNLIHFESILRCVLQCCKKKKIFRVIEALCDLENTTNVRLDEMIQDFNETLASLPKMIQEQTSNDIEDKFEKMTNTFNEALASLPEKVLESQGLCEFKFNDKCYWAVCHHEYDMNYTQSQQRCEYNGGKVATIFSETDYNAIMVYLRTKICYTRTYAEFWLSMIINPSTKVVTLPDRKQASYSEWQWYPGYPKSNAAFTRMFVQVNIYPSNRNQGVYDNRPSLKRNGVLCGI